MNIKNITQVFKGLRFSHVKTPLGRWNIHNDKETTLKIKYATEDNCGIYYNNYKNKTLIKKNNQNDDNDYIYMMGYESVNN